MAYIDFKKLKARVSITDIIDHYGLLADLEESTQGYEGTCPFCGSNAFKVNTGKNVWFCFGECKTHCKEGDRNGGNILDFVMKQERGSPVEAAQRIADWFPEEGTQKKPRSKGKIAKSARSRKPKPRQEETDEGEGSAEASQPSEDLQENLEAGANKPLEFTLKSVVAEHSALEGLGLEQETLKQFGVGYFTGKGTMHDRVVIPIHDKYGSLVAYAGYTPDEGYTYPSKDKFDPRLELYNAWRVGNLGLAEHGIVLVTDLLNVLRLHELGLSNVVAMPTETISPTQLRLLEELVGEGGEVDFVPWTREYVDTLAELVSRFHVRLHRYYEGSEDEFLSQVAHTNGW